jgi:EAL domain-containing protein (putative c-di-GMP-specific phosphodiesterase class I)
MEIVKEYEENIKWTSKLREAIEEDRIVPYFQPIVNTATGSIERYEALIRMHDNVGKPVSPYYFLEISKKAKLYGTLTKTMFAKTLKMFENSKYPVAFNISTEDILNESVKEFILARTEESMRKCKIIFEIVESDGIENYEEVSNFIAEVKKYGAQIAIDDFGTGYSNFEHLIKLKVDYIKIDGSLIKNMLKDKNSMVVVETIVDFASKLEIKTVAEFVESKEIAEAVNNMGIDYSQGYYFSEPLEYPVDRKSLP